MPRKDFILDTAHAADQYIPGITNIERGAEDGDINLVYSFEHQAPVNIRAVATDVSGYPKENAFFLCTLSNDAQPAINEALDKLQQVTSGMRVLQLLEKATSFLDAACSGSTQRSSFNTETNNLLSNNEEESDDDCEEEYWPDSPSAFDTNSPIPTHANNNLNSQTSKAFEKRMRDDVRTARDAGFRYGILGGMHACTRPSLLSMSIQVSRLGLSDEVIEAWDLKWKQYIVLLVRFSRGYKTLDMLIDEPISSAGLNFRIGVCSKYRPSKAIAMGAFAVDMDPESQPPNYRNARADDEAVDEDFNQIFISESLNNFMDREFIRLLKTRLALGNDWDGAKSYLDDQVGKIGEVLGTANEYTGKSAVGVTPLMECLPSILQDDHVRSRKEDKSLPLIAMQFAMRYLVRCTEFCLVCHDKMDAKFKAIRPYICSKPLCLYQYMSLGFGPSIEHEILTQPYLVDLLVSFCYAAAQSRRLREFPTGLSLSVPPLGSQIHDAVTGVPTAFNGSDLTPLSFKVSYNPANREIFFKDEDEENSLPITVPSLTSGDWVVLKVGSGPPTHYRIASVTVCSVKLAPEGIVEASTNSSLANGAESQLQGTGGAFAFTKTLGHIPPPGGLCSAVLQLYNQNFDELSQALKYESIVILLGTLPSILQMGCFLRERQRTSQPFLRQWVERISPAALGLLRWIVASNRSCIVQIDKYPGQSNLDPSIKADQKVSNMEGWAQFRFAQGAPDKEYRFRKALEDVRKRQNLTYPTIFAWHGSALSNWHSIIRTGLDFKETINGRSYGHGVYHAFDYRTSVGYSNNRGGNDASQWRSSELGITSALCLNEIVNAPEEFVATTPHLVVQHVDWIQVRYLFVQTKQENVLPDPNPNRVNVQQDPEFHTIGVAGKHVGIPKSVFPASRNLYGKAAGVRLEETPDIKRLKIAPTTQSEVTTIPEYDETDIEDREYLDSDDENITGDIYSECTDKAKASNSIMLTSCDSKVQRLGLKRKLSLEIKSLSLRTDFVPGALDHKGLQMLQPPFHATSTATRSLTKALKDALEVQDETPLDELGWYIDRSFVENVYQWIVELHSFDDQLPLAQDMKRAGITSIVLELRFGKEYPMSPPFVRVIRPRFMPFTHGGGGHVTSGGALCMELLTNSGWSAVSSIESVLIQVRLAIMNTEPRPARLAHSERSRDYGVPEAMQAYVRACNTHGWKIPPDFQELANIGASGDMSL